MKKYIITILIITIFTATPVYAQTITTQSIFPQIINLLVKINQLLIKQADLLKSQVADLQIMNNFLENRLQICSVPVPQIQPEPETEKIAWKACGKEFYQQDINGKYMKRYYWNVDEQRCTCCVSRELPSDYSHYRY